ncbi:MULTISPECIES: hypothetical protein [Streptomyces]|nr:hypothetical protein [Streptomyces sp. Root55]WRY85708.1 hypothetical protein OG388_32990 [Streptomyces clavifer]
MNTFKSGGGGALSVLVGSDRSPDTLLVLVGHVVGDRAHPEGRTA